MHAGDTDAPVPFEPTFMIITKCRYREAGHSIRYTKQRNVIEASSAAEIRTLGGDDTLYNVVEDEDLSICLFNFNPCHLNRVVLSAIEFPGRSGR